MARVVVTGMAGISSLGHCWSDIQNSLKNKTSGIRYMESWTRYEDLNTLLGGPVLDFERPKHYSRKQTRSMGRVALMAVASAEKALIDAGLLDDPCIQDGRMGVSYGSSTGSTDAIADFGKMLNGNKCEGLNANSYLKMMSHTAPVNLSVFFKLKGRTITTSSACTSGSQGIGYAYEAIKYGSQTLMLAGGGEELCPTEAAVFDTLYATSTKNDTPELTPRPFDRDRDGLVIGEGAGTLVLEELQHALARGAHIYAEIVGFATNTDGAHVTQPVSANMQHAVELALKDAQLPASEIGYISAHGTATQHGDIAESQAYQRVFGSHTPVSTLKSYTGHTLGACGALEAFAAISMLNDGWFHGNLNLDHVDPECGDIDYIGSDGRHLDTEVVMSNNFAFGGINTSLIFKRWPTS